VNSLPRSRSKNSAEKVDDDGAGKALTSGPRSRILIDIFGEDCVQNWLGGGAPNSLAVIDKDGKLVLWQVWSDAKELREKIGKYKTNWPFMHNDCGVCHDGKYWERFKIEVTDLEDQSKCAVCHPTYEPPPNYDAVE